MTERLKENKTRSMLQILIIILSHKNLFVISGFMKKNTRPITKIVAQ